MLRTATPAGRTEPAGPENDTDLVRQYLSQISATPLLTARDEVELSRRIEAGVYAAELLRQADQGEHALTEERRADYEEIAEDGRRAKDHMVRANLRLVVATAKKYFGRGLPFLDLIQEGNLGLIRAVEKFDYTKGYKFSTYAVWWIRQSIERGLAEQTRNIRLPVHVVEDLARVGRRERELRLRMDREPTLEEVAEASGLTPERVEELRRVARHAISLDTPVGDDGETRVSDLIEDTEVLQATDVVEFQALASALRSLIDTLPPREAMILCLRYGLHNGRPWTLQEVGDRVGLTRERVRQLEKQALAQLRQHERNVELAEWAG
ncbi:RNA polymerase nonessential primary-like sigma factor [Streptoalloteichus tenebrarius]|uniref:RNA polymerase sigma factor n=1 Tax=Streptoalloteichus tenebrarius (strain ATCC 17920 / DSM 40477 / JCM 4838 / CBS 697.72 / NBRC 16177 / NCIMB 11028 / NRRL B-12390 / A12253. 1 / ISP 5477) TaxID=1933 RepID=A0ABT1HYW9_STRSD|nr:sigma-70 family RNA polymerase sigma factor [Streptoalloteichus tenebrarius]MCP2260729.1 RNA polymerase nonessential primary-like sigma factor [Streptoalloteichus tenebrarius]BFF03737.1 sigma-70 family RNA polymerase sigma factor [Streptoalloteichus tenebrarius]